MWEFRCSEFADSSNLPEVFDQHVNHLADFAEFNELDFLKEISLKINIP